MKFEEQQKRRDICRKIILENEFKKQEKEKEAEREKEEQVKLDEQYN